MLLTEGAKRFHELASDHGGAKSDPAGVGQRARRRVAYRLLPFVFLLYIVNYIDRVNVSFANLRMSADLGFSDRVYGLGIGMFYITYVLFEAPSVASTVRNGFRSEETDYPGDRYDEAAPQSEDRRAGFRVQVPYKQRQGC